MHASIICLLLIHIVKSRLKSQLFQILSNKEHPTHIFFRNFKQTSDRRVCVPFANVTCGLELPPHSPDDVILVTRIEVISSVCIYSYKFERDKTQEFEEQPQMPGWFKLVV